MYLCISSPCKSRFLFFPMADDHLLSPLLCRRCYNLKKGHRPPLLQTRKETLAIFHILSTRSSTTCRSIFVDAPTAAQCSTSSPLNLCSKFRPSLSLSNNVDTKTPKKQSEKSNCTITNSRICHLKSEIQGEIGIRVVDPRDRD
ncbi:unnamed protein product [Lactuca saligna]|uniref:Uncharacterized protein n=1 Tax=Lactuca saligna TaxID=75948 RepID=A0AA35ZVM8_LACSI|nr:unnamed protein product [Lactuca saligna]